MSNKLTDCAIPDAYKKHIPTVDGRSKNPGLENLQYWQEKDFVGVIGS